MIMEVQFSQHNATFRVFSIYVGCCVERISDMQLISEQSHWQTQTKARRAVAPSYFVSAREPPPGSPNCFSS